MSFFFFNYELQQQNSQYFLLSMNGATSTQATTHSFMAYKLTLTRNKMISEAHLL
jgi:hypothetical protein